MSTVNEMNRTSLENAGRRAAGAVAPIVENINDKVRASGYPTRVLAGIGLAAAATVFGVLGIFGEKLMPGASIHFNSLWAVGMLLGLVSYLLAGGLVHACKGAWGIARFTWFMIPIFPVDLILGLLGLVLGCYVFISMPIIFVLKAAREKYGR